MTMTQRYAGVLRRQAGDWDKRDMPVQAECARQAARHMEELQAAKDAIPPLLPPGRTVPQDRQQALPRAALGVAMRVEHIGDATLYLGDCLEILPHLPKVDACITDPPYGMGRDGKPASTSSHGGHKGYEFMGWDGCAPTAEAFALMKAAAPVQVIWGANFYPEHFSASMGWLVWDKGQRISQSDAELAYTNLPKALRVFTLNRAAIAQDGAVHPTQKPLALMKWCIDQVGAAAGTILDPFMGSGTTGVAAIQMGRKFIGIEREPKYFDIACRRIEQAAKQGQLFEPPAAKPLQMEIA